MNRSLLLTAAFAALCSAEARANGGGYDYGVQFTGGVAPFQASGAEHVRIEEERLDIALRRTQAVVTVRYTMRNVSGKAAKVRFGFPVEAISLETGDCDGEDEAAMLACRRKDLRESIGQLHGYTVTAGGQSVKAEYQIEPFAEKRVQPFPGSEKLARVAGWMVSEVTFPVDAPVALEIRYAAEYAGGSYSTDDTTVFDGTFRYRLSTGAIWNGPIGKGTITVRADGIAPEEVRIERGGLTRANDGWVREFSNLEPTLADDLEVRAIPGFFAPGYVLDRGAYRGFLFRGTEPRDSDRGWGGAHQQYTATASSTLRPAKDHGFGAGNLHRASQYPWAEGAPGWGIGEWVELTPAKPRPLLAIEISSGFQDAYGPKGTGLFAKNGRPSRVEILLNGEHRFEATLGDVQEGQLVPVIGYAKPVSKIRITILEVYPGTKYEDTCIARIVLYDALPKRPDVRIAR